MPLISNKILLLALMKGFFTLWPMWLVLGFFYALKLGFKLWEKHRLFKSGINDIDHMDGLTFEKYLEVLFEKLGYRVERTQYVGDYGADLITTKDGIRTVIQAKRYKNTVGIKAIQEAVAAKGKYKCSKAMAVTNSFYTKQAIELAWANNVELWNRDHLIKALLSIKRDNVLQESQIRVAANMEEIVSNNNVCCMCGEVVSEKVKRYCLSNKQKYSGKIYCFDHQVRA